MMFHVAVLLFVAVCHVPVLNAKSVGFDSSNFCKHDPRVETFATTYFTATVVQHGCDVVTGVEVTGPEAFKSEHDAVLDILSKEGMCTADWAAYTCGRPFLSLDRVTAAYYLEKSAHSAGKVFLKYGLFDCNSSISLALEWYALAKKTFEGLDERQLGSYQRANVQGIVDLTKAHGLNVEDVFNDISFSFYNEFDISHGGNCTTKQ